MSRKSCTFALQNAKQRNKCSIMETITLSYNPRSAVALSMLAAIRASQAFIEEPNSATIAAIQELEAGRGTRAKDSHDLFKQILG